MACKHGKLDRSCDTCTLQAEVEQLQAHCDRLAAIIEVRDGDVDRLRGLVREAYEEGYRCYAGGGSDVRNIKWDQSETRKALEK